MAIQKQFRLRKIYTTPPHFFTGRRLIDLVNKIASSQAHIFPSNSTNININLSYKGQIVYGKLLEVLSDIREIGDAEIFETANASFSANLNPIKSLSFSFGYKDNQIDIHSNNLSKEEFEQILQSIEDFFPITKVIDNSDDTSTNRNQNASENENSKASQSKQQSISKSVFVIMSFNDEHRDSYFVAIQPTLKKMGFNPIRVDEIQHNNTVTKEIIEAIESSAFVVADLTGERPNVYYEVGYAHKADKEVVLLAKKGTSVHFDVAAINRIDYKDYTDLSESLTKRVRAVANRLGIPIIE